MVELVADARRRLRRGAGRHVRGGARAVRRPAAGDGRPARARRASCAPRRPTCAPCRPRALPGMTAADGNLADSADRAAGRPTPTDPLHALPRPACSRRPMRPTSSGCRPDAVRATPRRRRRAGSASRATRTSWPWWAGRASANRACSTRLAGSAGQRRVGPAADDERAGRLGARRRAGDARAAARLARRRGRPRARGRRPRPGRHPGPAGHGFGGDRASRPGRGGPAPGGRRRLGDRPGEVPRRGPARRLPARRGCRDSPARSWSSTRPTAWPPATPGGSARTWRRDLAGDGRARPGPDAGGAGRAHQRRAGRCRGERRRRRPSGPGWPTGWPPRRSSGHASRRRWSTSPAAWPRPPASSPSAPRRPSWTRPPGPARATAATTAVLRAVDLAGLQRQAEAATRARARARGTGPIGRLTSLVYRCVGARDARRRSRRLPDALAGARLAGAGRRVAAPGPRPVRCARPARPSDRPSPRTLEPAPLRQGLERAVDRAIAGVGRARGADQPLVVADRVPADPGHRRAGPVRRVGRALDPGPATGRLRGPPGHRRGAHARSSSSSPSWPWATSWPGCSACMRAWWRGAGRAASGSACQGPSRPRSNSVGWPRSTPSRTPGRDSGRPLPPSNDAAGAAPLDRTRVGTRVDGRIALRRSGRAVPDRTALEALEHTGSIGHPKDHQVIRTGRTQRDAGRLGLIGDEGR